MLPGSPFLQGSSQATNGTVFDSERAEQLRKGPLEDLGDVDAAFALVRLTWDELLEYGTSQRNLRLDNISSATGRTVLPKGPTLIPPTRPELVSFAYDTPVDLLLDVIDCLLSLLPFVPPTQSETDPLTKFIKGFMRVFQGSDVRTPLQQILDDACSVYAVRANGSGLERRIDAAAIVAGTQAVAAAERAGYPTAVQRLRSAWEHVTALRPNPGAAYADAVRAVEAIANPYFIPKNLEPTLGQVLSHLVQGGHKYELVVADRQGTPADIEAITKMIGTLWWGHRDRHEGGPTSAPISQEAAEAAVVLATALVQLLASGTIQRKP